MLQLSLGIAQYAQYHSKDVTDSYKVNVTGSIDRSAVTVNEVSCWLLENSYVPDWNFQSNPAVD